MLSGGCKTSDSEEKMYFLKKNVLLEEKIEFLKEK